MAVGSNRRSVGTPVVETVSPNRKLRSFRSDPSVVP
jgi:hypothetical protein